MPSPSPSPSPDDDDSDRLAQLERMLAAQLYSESAAPLPPSAPAVEPAHEAVAVEFRLFSSQKAPTRVTIKEQTPPPLAHRKDPRIRAVEDEDPRMVQLRNDRIQSIAQSGQEILQQSKSLPCPHGPNYRLTTRKLPRVPHAPSNSTREPLDLPRLGYLNSILPRPLHSLSPLAVPVRDLDHAPKEPNQGLISNGPYDQNKDRRGGGGTRMKKRLPIELQRRPEVDLVVVPILGREKVSTTVWNRMESAREKKELDKARKKKLKLLKLREIHGDHHLQEEEGGGKEGQANGEKRNKKGRLSKERRERAKKRAALKQEKKV